MASTFDQDTIRKLLKSLDTKHPKYNTIIATLCTPVVAATFADLPEETKNEHRL